MVINIITFLRRFVSFFIVTYLLYHNKLDYIKRTEQIQAAYALICYTAYFEALQTTFPDNIKKELKLKLEEKKELIEEAVETTELKPVSNQDIHCNIFYADHATSFSEIEEKLVEIYDRITQGLIKMISDSSLYNENNEKDQHEFEKLKHRLLKLPQKAFKIYEAQYLELADQFEDFAFFAQLQNFKGLHHAIKQNKTALELLTANITKKIDVGFNNLNSIVSSIVSNYSTIQAQKIIDELKLKYISLIEEPIIDAKEIKPDTEKISLRFPKIIDAFIPQSYKCLTYKQKGIKLEDSPIWEQLPVNYDLNNFFIKYLYSPGSIDYPLIILGHPGSGKSLLTKVLSAQLMCNSYTVIRIPLREVNADDGIDILVEDHIKKLTNRSLSAQGYGDFAGQFSEKPLIIILDGYDELLQAKGDVFSSYLERARIFQHDQKLMRRPVRIIITSRITLIDKARIPENSTILRLMEFNEEQREAWINIWNKINADYFINYNIKPFKLPIKTAEKKNNVIELAEQPLLLLMLALYDAESNDLAKTNSIGRTELYDNLLRRFVRRERRRYVPDFIDKTLPEQEKIIDQEMNRLGVIAIGMYNRRDVVIRSEQLEKDLESFQAHRDDGSPKAKTLKEAESVLGSFFFIHQSTAQDVAANGDNSENAYEFLHNTFGEFLAADFILRNTINEVKNVYVERTYKLSDPTTILTAPDTFNSSWYYCLMFVPLYSRPVIVEMLREHAIKAFQHSLQIDASPIKLKEDDFIENLKFIIKNQLKMILNTRNTPKVMSNGVLFDNDMPLLGYLSTYSLNLIILACTISNNGFEFNEDEYRNFNANELDLKPWDKLASLWKTWFSSADLAGLSAILKAKRINDTTVLALCNEKFEAMRYEQPIDILLCISSTLVDNLLIGLSGLQTERFSEITRMSNKEICQMLCAESPDLYFSYLINLLRKKANQYLTERNDYSVIYNSINKIINIIIDDKMIYQVNSNTLLNFFEILECCHLRNMIFFSTRIQLIDFLPHLIDKISSQKKKYKSSEMLSGVQLLQLLTDDVNHLTINKYIKIYDTHFTFNSLMERSKSHINYIIHNLTDYAIDNDLFYFNYRVNNTLDDSLLNVIENSPEMEMEDRVRFLKSLISLDNLDVMLETNPELLSRAILILVKGENISQRINSKNIIYIFLNRCLQLLESNGVEHLGFDTIINILWIVRITRLESFDIKFVNLMREVIFTKNPETLSVIIYFHPAFVANLIEIMPDIFNEAYLGTYKPMLFEKRIRNIETKDLFNYIKLYRCIRNRNILGLFDILHKLNTLIHSAFVSDVLKRIDYNNITIEQLNDLIWYSNFVNDKLILEKTREIIQHYPNLKEMQEKQLL